MDFRDFSIVQIRTGDGWVDMSYSECRNLFSKFIDLMSDESNQVHYINMPDSTSASIKHILSIFNKQFSISFNKDDVKDIQETARMLGVSSGLSDLVAKKYQRSEAGAMQDLFFITSEKDIRRFKCKEQEFRNDNSNMMDVHGNSEQQNVKDEEMDYKIEPKEDDSDENTEKTSPRKYIKGGSEEHKKMKERMKSRLDMRDMVVAEPERVRLFDRNGDGGKQEEYMQFPGLILDNQRTKFTICVECCEVFFVRTIPKIMQHRCRMKTEVLKYKPIEVIETRSKFHDSNFLKHYYTEVNVDTIKCNECDCDLNKISELKEHLRKVHEIKPNNHMCPECGNTYTSKMMVRQHQVEKHERSDLADFNCEQCDRTFVEKCLLATHHKLFHTDEKPHICDVCAQGFKRKAHLDRHKLIHTGERNYPCRHCEMAFSTDWTRTQHERIHLGIKPYKCEECDKEFSQKTSLDSHNKVHHNANSYCK